MNINKINNNNINFGRIVKVNAPVMPAMEIASIANGYSGQYDKTLQSQISGLFPDKQKDMVSIEVIDYKTSYLFSGKEGKEYQKIYNNTRRVKDRIKQKAKQSYNVDYLLDQEDAKRKTRVLDLVHNKGNVTEINVEMSPRQVTVKSINIVA